MDKVIPLEHVTTRIRKIDDRISEMEAEMAELRVEKRMLNNLAESAVTQYAKVSDKPNTPRGGTTGLIFDLVKSHPGLTAHDVSERLEDKVETESKDKRRLLYNSTINMTIRGTLKKDESGRLFINDDTAA